MFQDIIFIVLFYYACEGDVNGKFYVIVLRIKQFHFTYVRINNKMYAIFYQPIA